MDQQNHDDKLKHAEALSLEIEHLKTLLQPTDTGHIHTAINVLKWRVQELLSE